MQFEDFGKALDDMLEKDDGLIEDAEDLNQKFLAQQLGVDAVEIALLQKLELRVDTSCHNLQVMGETLQSMLHLRLNDSIIKSFRDLGTGFKDLQILDVSRCELKEIYGLTAFPSLQEFYASYNEIDELYDI